MDYEIRGEFSKLDSEERLAFGWASIVREAGSDTDLLDYQDDIISVEHLEKSAYSYNLDSRDSDVMHRQRGVARLVESIVFTEEKIEKMGLDPATVPVGWWVGFKVDDDNVWKRVKDGELRMFSIAGRGRREEIDA